MTRAADLGLTAEGRRRTEQAMQRFVDSDKVAGLVTTLGRGSSTPDTRAYGVSDRQTGDAMQPTTLFRIASLTKPITAAATLMLVEDGALTLDDPVAKYIPGFADLRVLVDANTDQTAPIKRPITVRHLLTHTSGLAYGLFEGPVASRYRRAGVTRMKLSSLIETLPSLPLVAQPGDRFHYSISYDVLGYLIEQRAEQAFDAFLRSRIFQPLGMDDTGFVVPEVLADRLAAVYGAPDGSEDPGDLAPLDLLRDYHDPARPRSGGGGLVSTAPDYLRFVRMLLNGGELDGTRLLQTQTVKAMISNQIPERMIPISMGLQAMAGMGYGYGFGVKVTPATSVGDPPEGAFWWAGMTGTLAWGDPHHDLIGIVMTQAMRYWEPAYTFQRLTYRALATD